MTEKTGHDFVSSNWQVIAKFSYENFLRFGFGAVIFFDKENNLDGLGYVQINNLFSALESGNLIDTEGQQLAHVKSFVFDSVLEEHPLMPKDMPKIRKVERQILDKFLEGHDPDYDVIYVYVTGQTARIGITGSSTNCPARIYNIERTPEIDYFPEELMSGDFDSINKSTRRHCSQHLQSMDEPVLAHLQEDTKEAYRFLWLRSFYQPIAVRVEKNKSNYSIVTKELEGVGGYYPKKLSRQTYDELDYEQWEQIVSLIEKTHFWQTPHYRENLVLDGADWVLEGYRDKKYYAVFRCSPEPDSLDKDFRGMCLYLLGLSDIKVPIREVY